MSLEIFRLDGRVAIITGASKGVGSALAKALASAGAQVVVCSRHGDEAAKVLKDITQETGREGLALSVDVSRRIDVERLASATLSRFGKIDILVNNAAINLRSPILEMTDEDFSRVMDINYKGAYLCCQIIGRHMVEKQNGRVINVASIAAVRGAPRISVYCSSKGALLQLTRALALEWAPYNVLVNALCPGPFDTPMNDDIRENPDAYRTSVERVPLRRWGNPAELSGAVIFLASDASTFVTGSALYVDGGLSAQ